MTMEEDPVDRESTPWKARLRFPRLPSIPGPVATAISLLLIGVSLLLATDAQGRLDTGAPLAVPMGSFLVAALVFGLTVGRIDLETDTEAHTPSTLSSLRLSRLLPGFALGLLSFFAFGGNTFRTLGLFAWLGGLALCLYAIRGPVDRREAVEQAPTGKLINSEGLHVSWHWLGLGIITIIGAIFRLYRLNEIPADMGWDLPYNYFDADRILSGEYWIFFPHNLGREGLFFYLIALCSKTIGLSPYSIQLTSALVGILTIPAVYLLAKHAFNHEVALYAATLLAVSKWHVVLSRSGYRVILMPFLSALALYFLVRALRTRRASFFGWLGITLGLGLHSYKAFLFVPPAVALAVGVHLALHREQRSRDLLKGLTITLILTALVYVPMGRYLWDHPQSYFQRELVQFSTLKTGFGEDISILRDTLYNFRTSLLMFNHIGDGNSRFNVPYQRHLGYVSGVLLVLGLGYALVRPKRGYVSIFTVFWLTLILPMTVTMVPREMPNIFRSSGAIGPSLVLAALPLAALRRWLAPRFRPWARTPLSLRVGLESSTESRTREWGGVLSLGWIPVALVLGAVMREGVESYRFYFTDYVRYLPDVWNFSLSKEMATTIEDFTDGPTFIVAWPHWYDGNALKVHLLAKGRAWDGELLELVPEAPPLSTLRGKALFVLHPEDVPAERLLSRTWPRGVFVNRLYPNGEIAYRQYYCET